MSPSFIVILRPGGEDHTDWHVDEVDGDCRRKMGVERISGFGLKIVQSSEQLIQRPVERVVLIEDPAAFQDRDT